MQKTKINKKRVFLFLVLPLLFIACAIGAFFYFKSKELKVEYESEIKISLGEEANLTEGINIQNGKLKDEEISIDT